MTSLFIDDDNDATLRDSVERINAAAAECRTLAAAAECRTPARTPLFEEALAAIRPRVAACGDVMGYAGHVTRRAIRGRA